MKPTPARRISRGHRLKVVKEAVIREPYVAITGNFRRALILNQFLYWTDKTFMADKLMEEDNERRIAHGQAEVKYRDGWIYKTAKELLSELMLDCSEETLRRELKFLVDVGLLQKRRNPDWAMDATLQYRVDFLLLARKLKESGYSLEKYYYSEMGQHPDIDSAIPPAVESIPLPVECNPPCVEALPDSTISEITNSESTSCTVRTKRGEEMASDEENREAQRLFDEASMKVQGNLYEDVENFPFQKPNSQDEDL